MKEVSKYLIILLFFCSITKPVLSQLSFSVDSLHVRNVLWLCKNDVVISHFAYGPYFDMHFSIKNDSDDTIFLNWEKTHIYIRYSYKRDRRKNETVLELKTTDSIVVLFPNSSLHFYGNNFLVLDGEITMGLNYRLVNFLPEIGKIIKHSNVVLEIDGMNKTITTFKNCYVGEPFFIDGTDEESIYDLNY